MPRKSRQLNLKAYMKEEMITLVLKLPRSQCDLLTTMAAMTHQAVPDLVASLLANRVMADVEKLVRDSQTPPNDTTPIVGNAPTVKNPGQDQPAHDVTPAMLQSRPSVPVGSVESHVQRSIENGSATNLVQPETQRAPQPTPAAPMNPARPPQVLPNPSIAATGPSQQAIPPRPLAQPLPPTSPRPITPPAAKPPSGEAQLPLKPETRHE